MTGQNRAPRRSAFWIIFAVITLLIAGGVSYLASPSPDGLDSATLRGCEVIENNGVEQLAGQCIAQSATDHPLAASPLADYTLAGGAGTGGIAGVIGVLLILVLTGAVVRLITRARRGPRPTTGS